MLTLVTTASETLPRGMADHLPPVIRAEVQARAQMADMTVDAYVQYASDCLEGKRFPDVGDAWLRRYCREHFRLREVIELYKRYHVASLKRNDPLTSRLRNYLPSLASLKLSEITRQGVIEWYHQNATRSRTQAIGAVKTLRAIYNKAIEWELYDGKNPATGVKGLRMQSRTRFVQPGDEMKRLLESLLLEPDAVQAFFLTCLFCGCRNGEARTMRWADLDFIKNLWHKPMTKTGVPHTIPLPDEIVGRLKALPRFGIYVFGTRRGKDAWPTTTVWHYWKRIRERAGLQDVTIHDLRRTWASWAAMDGENLSIIAAVLNHSSLQHTQIYARLNAAPIYKAMAKQAAAMRAAEGTAEQEAAKAAQRIDPFAPEPERPFLHPRKVIHPPASSASSPPPAPFRPDQVSDSDGMEWPG